MKANYELDNKWVLITGASSGIGGYFSELFCQQGCNLVITARRETTLQELANKLCSTTDKKIIPIALDVSNQGSVDHLMQQLQSQNIVIDVLINNAGIAETNSFTGTTYDAMVNVMTTNFCGAWYLSQCMTKQWINSEHQASIINIASILGEAVTQNTSVYAATKSALIQSSKVQALELARYGIRVNCISPGYILTPLNEGFFSTKAGETMIKRIPQRRLGHYEDLAGAVLLLASPLSRYMTGSNITVDGGHVCRTL